VRRNPQNLGIGAHYNAAIKDSAGQLLVTAAGDDISLPHRVQTLAAAWDASGQKADLLSSHLVDMSADGMDVGTIRVDDLARWKRPEDWVRKRPYVVGASHAFTRRMHERFGPIRADLPYEDQAMALRASCMGGGITVPEALVKYRRGGVSAGATQRLTAEANQKRLQTKYVRQIALYSQIRHDLLIVDREDLWIGRIRKRMSEVNFLLLCKRRKDGGLDCRLSRSIPGLDVYGDFYKWLLINGPGFDWLGVISEENNFLDWSDQAIWFACGCRFVDHQRAEYFVQFF
jgi:hypothetical protein